MPSARQTFNKAEALEVFKLMRQLKPTGQNTAVEITCEVMESEMPNVTDFFRKLFKLGKEKQVTALASKAAMRAPPAPLTPSEICGKLFRIGLEWAEGALQSGKPFIVTMGCEFAGKRARLYIF